MPTKKQKEEAYSLAADLTREFCKGGSNNTSPDSAFRGLYFALLEIKEDIEKTQD